MHQLILRCTLQTDQQTAAFEPFYIHLKYLFAKQCDESIVSDHSWATIIDILITKTNFLQNSIHYEIAIVYKTTFARTILYCGSHMSLKKTSKHVFLVRFSKYFIVLGLGFTTVATPIIIVAYFPLRQSLVVTLLVKTSLLTGSRRCKLLYCR